MSYRRYAVDRVVSALVIFWLVLTGIYLMFHVAAGPEDVQGRVPGLASREPVQRFFDESYVELLSRIVSDGPLSGRSFSGVPVSQWVGDAVPATLSLLLFAFAAAALLAVPLGIVWGVRRPGRITRPLKTLSAVVFGLSVYSTTLLLIYVVGWKWSLLPLGGYCDLVDPATECGGVVDWARALVLPGITLGMFFGAIHLRVVSALVRNAEHARRNGIERARVTAALSYLKLLGRDFGFAVGLCVLTEMIFGIPGLGRTFVGGYSGFDAPVMEAVLIVATGLAMAVNLAIDLAVAAVDPSFRRF